MRVQMCVYIYIYIYVYVCLRQLEGLGRVREVQRLDAARAFLNKNNDNNNNNNSNNSNNNNNNNGIICV